MQETTSVRTMASAAKKPLVLTSLALGVVVLLLVPLHAAFRADDAVLADDDYLHPACRTPIQVLPEPICPEVVAGESPATLLFALVVVPLLSRRPGRGSLLAIAMASAALATVQVVAPFAYSFPAVDGERPSPFEADAGCGLVNCGLDHTLFHLVQVPFLLAMAVIAYRLHQTSGEEGMG
jgi:hypothetical protein